MHQHARTLPYGLQTFPFKRCSFVAWEKDEQKREQINPDHFHSIKCSSEQPLREWIIRLLWMFFKPLINSQAWSQCC
jgi:hypothetical protein